MIAVLSDASFAVTRSSLVLEFQLLGVVMVPSEATVTESGPIVLVQVTEASLLSLFLATSWMVEFLFRIEEAQMI